MKPSFFPSPYAVCHIARQVDTGATDPDTGNPVVVDAKPVIRYAQAIDTRPRYTHQVISEEFVKRVEVDVHLVVSDPETYNPHDQVLLFPQLDAQKEWVPGTGVAFWIDGMISDKSLGPFPYFKLFGGVFKLRRVT